MHERHLGAFRAAGSDGRTYTVDIYGEVLDGSDSGSLHQPIGRTRLVTADGYRVTRHEQGRYEVRETGVGLTSTDPAAP